MIECPVCLNVPRGTRPIPICSNGHIVCHPCKDRIRQDTLLTKCPSCMVDLGNATSPIASRLVEKVRHECENDGCEEMFYLSQLESHQKVCLFRKVLCPGRRVSCKLEMPFNKVNEHMKACPVDRFTKTFFWNFQNSRADLCYILGACESICAGPCLGKYSLGECSQGELSLKKGCQYS